MLSSLLKPKIKNWLNRSIESELFASNLYKHIANQLQRQGYFGCQEFFLKESADELTHYQIVVDYMNDMGDVGIVGKLPVMDQSILSIGDALYLAYNTEKDLMYQYQDFYEESEEMGDCITSQFLLQFLEIQRKSVGEYGDFISRYKKCGMNEAAILDFDKWISKK